MNIIFLSSMYPNSQIYMSGIFVHEQVKALQKLGYKITVIAPIPFTFWPFYLISPKWKKYSMVPRNEEIDGVKIIHTRYLAFPGGILKHLWPYIMVVPIYFYVKKILKKQNNTFFHTHGSLPDDYSAFLLSKLLRIPYVLTVHGETVYMKKKESHLNKSKIAIKSADVVIGVSSNVVQRIGKITGRKNGIFKIFNGFNQTNHLINTNKTKDKVKILFGATLIERKGCKYLIEAFHRLLFDRKDVELIIAGGGILLNDLKAFRNNLGLTQEIIFLGAVSHNKMIEEMAGCDIFCLPSWDEAFGVVYLEAMSFKKPIIGTIDEGISEVIIDGDNGFLVHPKNSREIYDKLKLLCSDSALRKKIGYRGFESIKNITWENNALENIKIYQKIVQINS